MPEIVATYDYCDPKGKLLYQNVRFDPKDFRQRVPDGNGGWTWGRNGTAATLYRLPELLASGLQDWAIITEGEKDANSLRLLGFTATTSGGADTWRPEFAKYFKGRLTAIMGDNDDAGRRYINGACASLIGMAGEVRIVSVPDGAKDISDWIDEHDSLDEQGLQARIQGMIDAAKPVTTAPGAEPRVILAVQRADGIEARAVTWFWPNRFPDCAFNVLSGDPGATKSFLTLYMASVVSRGLTWPDCPNERVTRGSVLLYSSEDDAGIIRTRLEAHKADAERVFICAGVQAGENGYQFDLNQHLNALERFLDEVPDTRLIILDPVTAYIGETNANSNSEVRNVLSPLADLATHRHVTIIGVNHHNKRQDLSYMYRGLGSTGFVAQARSVWAVVVDKDDEETRILAPIKANYSIKPTGLKYRIIDGAVTFEPDPWTGKLDDQLRAKDGKLRVEECAEWLRDRLSKGQTRTNTLIEEAKGAGFSRDLLYRAKERLGVRAAKDGFGGSWFWRLSDEE